MGGVILIGGFFRYAIIILMFRNAIFIILSGGGLAVVIVPPIVIALAVFVFGKLPCGERLYRLWVFAKRKSPVVFKDYGPFDFIPFFLVAAFFLRFLSGTVRF